MFGQDLLDGSIDESSFKSGRFCLVLSGMGVVDEAFDVFACELIGVLHGEGEFV